MKKLLLVILILLMATPCFAYRVDNVQTERASSVTGGTVKIIYPYTAVALYHTSVPSYRVTLRALNTNVNDIRVGGSAVSSDSVGLVLGHGVATTSNTVTIDVNDASSIYINSNRVNEGVSYLIEKR